LHKNYVPEGPAQFEFCASWNWVYLLGMYVSWCTALQAGRSWVRFPVVVLDVLLTYSFRPHYDPGVDSASTRSEYQEYFLGSKDGQCVGLTILPNSRANCFEIWEPQSSGNLRACPDLYRDWFVLHMYIKGSAGETRNSNIIGRNMTSPPLLLSPSSIRLTTFATFRYHSRKEKFVAHFFDVLNIAYDWNCVILNCTSRGRYSRYSPAARPNRCHQHLWSYNFLFPWTHTHTHTRARTHNPHRDTNDTHKRNTHTHTNTSPCFRFNSWFNSNHLCAEPLSPYVGMISHSRQTSPFNLAIAVRPVFMLKPVIKYNAPGCASSAVQGKSTGDLATLCLLTCHAQRLFSSDAYSLTCPCSSDATSAIALRVINVRKPPQYNKVQTKSRRFSELSALWLNRESLVISLFEDQNNFRSCALSGATVWCHALEKCYGNKFIFAVVFGAA
jgi:hypothetical protein